MRSAVALESSRAQAFASVMTTSATVSVPMDLHSAIEVAQHHACSLLGDLWKMGLDGSLIRGGTQAFCACTCTFPPSLIHFTSLVLRGLTPSESPSFLLIWTGLSPAGPCWSLQVPAGVQKLWIKHFAFLIMESMSHLVTS